MKKKLFKLRGKAVAVILILAIMIASTVIYVSYKIYSNTMDDHYREITSNVAKTAATGVDAQKVDKYTQQVKDIYFKNPSPEFKNDAEYQKYLEQYDSIKDEDYSKLFSTLDKIKQSNGVLSLYIVYMDQKTKTCVYVIDADKTENACPAGTWDIIYKKNYKALETPENGFPAYITNTEDYGWLCSAGEAIMSDDGRVIAHAMVDISMDKVMQDRKDFLIQLCITVLAVTAIMIILFIIAVNKALIDPINKLAHAAASYTTDKKSDDSDHKSAIELIQINTGDEIENLCHSLKQMEIEINGYIENLTTVTAEKERIGAELNVATQIQADMLPRIFPAFPEHFEFDIFATMDPAKEVGGDFYDFFLVDDDHLVMVMADVSGKGVPAALFMVIARTLIKNCAQTNSSPKDILEKVNKQLCENNDVEMFVTVWLGIIQLSTGVLKAANAGHEYPVLKKADGEFELIKDKHGFVLAGMEMSKYKEYELILGKKDVLYLYTDGVPEATSADKELYGTERMLKVLNNNKEASMEELLSEVRKDIDLFVGDAPQFDDITMLAFELSDMIGGNSLTVKPTEESISQVSEFVESKLKELNISDKIIIKVNIAVDEIYSNIVRCSGADSVTIVCAERDDNVQLIFQDNGVEYNPLKAEDPDISLSADERQIGGLGVFMVKKYMDTVEYQYKDGKNVLTIEKKKD